MTYYAICDDATGIVQSWYDTSFASYPNLDVTKAIVVPPVVWTARGTGLYALSNGHIVPYVAPPSPLADLIAQAKLRLASIRFDHEVAGVAFKAAGASASSLVASDRDSRANLVAAFVLASASPSRWQDGTAWKMADGSFVSLTSDDAIAMALTVQAYVSACFSYERDFAAKLDAAKSSDDIAAIDLSAGWPDNDG